MNDPDPYSADPDVALNVMVYDPAAHRLIIRDAILIFQGGRVVGWAHAEYDIRGVPDEYRDYLIKNLRRLRVGVPTWEDTRRSDVVMERWNRCVAEYEQLPWWKRMFRIRPRVSHVADAYDKEDPMPIPIWLIHFNNVAGRDPRPDEIDETIRGLLLDCADENERDGCYSAKDVAHMRWLARVPDLDPKNPPQVVLIRSVQDSDGTGKS